MQRNRCHLKRFVVAILGFVTCSAMIAVVAGLLAPVKAVSQPKPQAAASQMPDGAGKKIILGKCQLCHPLDLIVTSQRSKDDWQAVVDSMVERGAPLTEDETKTVVNYLAASFGPKGKAPAAPVTNAETGTPPPSLQSVIVDPDKTQFVTPPDSMGLPSHVQISVITGDFTKAGLFAAMLKLPSDQKIDPHWQSVDLDVVVLRGTYEVGNGDTYDAGKLHPLRAGEIVHFPAQQSHFGHAAETTIILVYGVGPVSITWLSK